MRIHKDQVWMYDDNGRSVVRVIVETFMRITGQNSHDHTVRDKLIASMHPSIESILDAVAAGNSKNMSLARIVELANTQMNGSYTVQSDAHMALDLISQLGTALMKGK